ncbi:hypothetical protein [Salinarimonas rosea]|uniref:hypothetical protein n=1 Tax=Salinarimonas rosea TaxID=552063 RepID=UPI0012EC2A3B|nr:hypothetical protein [Salinarimonas rosea]
MTAGTKGAYRTTDDAGTRATRAPSFGAALRRRAGSLLAPVRDACRNARERKLLTELDARLARDIGLPDERALPPPTARVPDFW